MLIPCASSAQRGDAVEPCGSPRRRRSGRASARFSSGPPSSPAGSGCSQYSTPASAAALERLVERPPLVDVHLERQLGDGADGAHALDVEPVAAAELQLQPPEAARGCLLGAARHVVGVAEPDRPRGRRPVAAQPEQPPDGQPASFPWRSCSAPSSAARAAFSPGGSAASISSSANGSSPSETAPRATRAPRLPDSSYRSIGAASPNPVTSPCLTSTWTTSSSSSDSTRDRRTSRRARSVTTRAVSSTGATLVPPSARSSGDRAFASGAKGRRFDSCRAHCDR